MLPEVLKGADLSKCAKVEYAGDEDIYQIGDYLIVKGDVDQSRLSDDYIFIWPMEKTWFFDLLEIFL